MATSATPTLCDRRGKDMTLYLNTGTLATPVWIQHLGLTGDVSINEVEDEEQLETRSSTRFVKEYIEGDIDLTISGTQLVDENYEGYLFLYAMRVGGEARDVMVLTDTIDVEGAVGWRGKMRNKDRSITGAATGGMSGNYSLRPAACTDTPVTPVKIAIVGPATTTTPEVWDPTTYTTPV